MQIQNSRAIPPTYDSTHLTTSKAEATKTSLPVAKSETSGDSRETVVISALGRTLGAAISRAEAYHANASRGELRAIVDRTNNMLMGTGQRDTVKPDQETPKYGDDERVSISRKATEFIEKVAKLPRSNELDRENPFYGLGRVELAAIKYDESGTFTVNERRAASSEAGRQYGEWSSAANARAWDESTQTGKLTHFLREVLAYFDALPPIERQAAPEGYEERLRSAVSATVNDDTPRSHDWLNMLFPRQWRTEGFTNPTIKDKSTC